MLDSLQNTPLDFELNKQLFELRVPNYQALTPSARDKMRRENAKLCGILNAKIARPFSFSLESFYFLLQFLSTHYKVALALSSHNLLYKAYLLLENKENIIPLVPDFTLGVITESQVQKAVESGADCFIIPYLNEDILTKNPLEFLPKNALNIVDLSYAFALNLPLEIPQRVADIVLINGENLGIMRPFGILASKQDGFFGIPSVYLEIENLYSVFYQAILKAQKKRQDRIPQDLAKDFYNILKASLKDDCYYFYQTPANTLSLGLKGIKARDLIQSLIFEQISVINGQSCLFGFFEPSFVLKLMGYDETQQRELLSLSFIDITPSLIPQIAQKVAQKYLQILSLN
ncbi:MAG: nitrogen fixation protein NifS [Helicobacteraceae bacterium]|nr:nitrogen fixation protein NifS [Helicobacteraceae bacterium]